MMTANEIRQAFLDFFRSKGHQVVPSAPIVIKNDPTLLFTNAGMNQFKEYFLGNKTAPFKRAVDTQKCLRVSGKHNDLEEVGVDTYHHTMFEMLGNWSFGDYFKNEAIEWSWELLTEIYKIPKDRLYATVFEGDEKEKIPPSKIALAKWKELLPPDHIVMGNKKDNFWEMGDTGPCGPCSEIHVDCRSEEERKKIPGHELVNKDHPQVIEIWNNVFIQFNRKKDGSLEPLPATHVDTGMGLERLVRVLQNKNSNYDTDIFTGTIAATEKLSGKKYDGGDGKTAVAFRVIADHIRAIGFTIADGQLPSNTGAGYVIRRILRRAVRYYYSYLDHKAPLLYQLIPVLAEQFRHVFPELAKQSEFVGKVVREEEEAFLRTLDKGLKRIEEMILNSKGRSIDGKAAFELYDTYGFPIDLTRLIASEKNLQVDEPGFEKEMQEQKNRSRAATAIDAGDWTVLQDQASALFRGYEQLDLTATITRYRKVKAKGKESFQIVLDQTPFYAESGGQVGDTGTLTVGGETIEVTDTKKENDLIIHFCEQFPQSPQGPVTAAVNKQRRQSIVLHHSATHLLHAALRRVLGTHVAQKGSLVQEGNLRFDFSHFAKVTAEELSTIESLVNEKIRQNIPVVIREMPRDEALQLGAMALFGEKYGDRVRVVTIDPDYSIELCGGTHAGHTGMLGFFKITTETAVAAGVRRIEAVAGTAAAIYINEQLAVLDQVKEVFKNPKELVRSVENQLNETAEMRKKIEQLEQRLSSLLVEELVAGKQTAGPVNFIARVIDVPGPEVLKKVCHDLKDKIKNHVAVLATSVDGKAYVAVGISEELVTSLQLDAGKIIKEHVAPAIKGGGGGQKILATAGGQDSSRFAEIFQVVKKLL